MLSVIKTAIITIIISFISGVLLDHYKNVAPRIVCHIGKCVPVRLRNRRIRTYILTIRNISKQTIHDLNLNLQAPCENFKIDDAKITKGLKFDVSKEGNIYDVSIPFLSKNDEFSVKVFLEGSAPKNSRPIIALRSPENFKRIDSDDEDGFINSIKSIPESVSGFFSNRKNSKGINNAEKSFFRNKKVIIAIASVILLIFTGILTAKYCKNSSEPANAGKSVSGMGSSENTVNSDAKSNSGAGSNEKQKTPAKGENSSKDESSSGIDSNAGGNRQSSSTNKNAKTSNGAGAGRSTTKNSEEDTEKNSETNNGTSANEKENDNSDKLSQGSSTQKNSEEKSSSNDTNKSISQGSGSKTGTENSKTP